MFAPQLKKNWKTYIVRAITLAVASYAFFNPTPAKAQNLKRVAQAAPSSAPAPGQPAPGSGDKLDVSDLENKYWAAKDTDFNVVQNRLFSKAGRVAVSLNYGESLNDSWSDGPTMGGSINYYFNERYGAEVSYTKSDTKDSEATEKLKSFQGGAPNHNKMKDFYGAAFNWVPFYAKMSVLNSSIIYFDMSFSAGLGMVSYEQQMLEGNANQTAPAVTLDISQHFFLSKWLALRVDLKNRWYNEDVVTYKLPTGGAPRSQTSELNHQSLLSAGLTFYF